MKPRTGRPPKKTEGDWAPLSLRVPSAFKNHLIEVADGYDMTITEYLMSLVERDAPIPDQA